MYLRAKYTKYKMAKTKFSIWRYVICEICKKNGSNRPFLASRVADTIFPPPIEGHHRQLDNQCKDPMDKTKDCRVGQLTNIAAPCFEEMQKTSFSNLDFSFTLIKVYRSRAKSCISANKWIFRKFSSLPLILGTSCFQLNVTSKVSKQWLILKIWHWS